MKLLVCNAEEADVVGHHASIVLSQIRYWLYKANNGENRYVRTRGGQRWLAHSRDQLCEETHLSPRQMRDALAKLKKHDFVRIEQHLFHGKNVSHFQAANQGHLAQKGVIEMAQEVPPTADKSAHAELDSDDQLIEEENDLKIEGDYGAPNAPTLFGKKIRTKEEEEEAGPHAGEIKPPELSAIFRGAWNKVNPHSYLPEFDTKQMGQFKNLLHRCPVGEAAAVVEYSVRHWDAFCSYAIGREGAFKLPSMPDVGSLLRFVQSAVHLYHDHRASHTKPAPKKSVPPVPEQMEPVGEKPMSLEEVAKDLGKQF